MNISNFLTMSSFYLLLLICLLSIFLILETNGRILEFVFYGTVLDRFIFFITQTKQQEPVDKYIVLGERLMRTKFKKNDVDKKHYLFLSVSSSIIFVAIIAISGFLLTTLILSL